ncbi:hypothetical protein SAMD00019534_105920 [Acytostelium subglobosum LB1]|uniref:hypothetical protein n=1 Tax=Acytostelium subglobosum LB1 TaxID=1410327 RepID=UPI00064523BA|nr:hypothetical protein SAMD00019534_105920 [Acytostelium subglobosum LB1]GAM27416.1 hypothetical protein SAMD00019534_105920 [Acytostelium subglobosum LB1]|eukprot:XP_012749481.1 hypothetical protein SAMD00019534_105920 [Acytostelium subglobosum LB1]
MSNPTSPSETSSLSLSSQSGVSVSEKINPISSSTGNPTISPLSTFTPGVPSSLSASNSPLTSLHQSSYSGVGGGVGVGVGNAPPTSSNNMMMTGATTTTTPSSATAGGVPSSLSTQPMTLPQKEISVSCFEYLYIEIIQYIVASCKTDKTQIAKRLEKLGFKVGHKLVDKLSIDPTTLYTDPLDIVKFICKVFWMAVFKKSVDSLRTNHKGIFVLTEQKFQWLLHLSFDPSSTNKDCSEYVHFAVGLVKGAMANFGYKTSVGFEIQHNHTVVFTIRLEQ